MLLFRMERKTQCNCRPLHRCLLRTLQRCLYIFARKSYNSKATIQEKELLRSASCTKNRLLSNWAFSQVSLDSKMMKICPLNCLTLGQNICLLQKGQGVLKMSRALPRLGLPFLDLPPSAPQQQWHLEHIKHISKIASTFEWLCFAKVINQEYISN